MDKYITVLISNYIMMIQYAGAGPPEFSLGGGGGAQTIMCAHALHKREAWSPLRPGSRARLRALGAPGGFDALSCYLSLIFKQSDTKWDKKNPHIVDQILRGNRRAPSKSATDNVLIIWNYGMDC